MASQFTDLSVLSSLPKIPQKALGVWVIKDLKVAIPVYSWKLNTGNTQAILDAEDSALWQPYCNAGLISDHSGSISNGGKGIWRMEDVKLDTQAIYVRNGSNVLYRCYNLCRADFHTWGYTINGKLVTPWSSKDMICCSCVDNTGKEVYLAFFREVGTL